MAIAPRGFSISGGHNAPQSRIICGHNTAESVSAVATIPRSRYQRWPQYCGVSISSGHYTVESISAVATTLQNRYQRWPLHCGVGISGGHNTAESVLAVTTTPRSRYQRWPLHCGVGFSGGHYTAVVGLCGVNHHLINNSKPLKKVCDVGFCS